MTTVVVVAGYDKSDSDGFRKVISKKQKDKLPLHRKWFVDGRKQIDTDEYGKQKDFGHIISGGVEKGIERQALSYFFDTMEDFGKYAFNKSHAAAYAVVGYVTAWLKYYYAVEFMAALLNIQEKMEKMSRYINHMRNDLNIEVLSPDINYSSDRFEATPDGKVLFSLNAKGVSVTAMAAITEERKNREYTSFNEFLIRNLKSLKKSDIKPLAAIGAFRSIGGVASQIIASVEDIADKMKKTKDSMARAEKSNRPFNLESWMDMSAVIPDIEEYPNQILWTMEREYMGLYLTGNPLYNYQFHAEQYSNFKLSSMDYDIDEGTGDILLKEYLPNKKAVRFVGMFSDINIVLTRAKKEKMAITEVVDLTGETKMLIWPSTYASYEDLIKEDRVFDFKGYLKIEPDEAPVIILDTLTPLQIPKFKKAFLREEDPFQLQKILNEVAYNAYYQGNTPLYVVSGNIRMLLTHEYWVNLETFPSLVSGQSLEII